MENSSQSSGADQMNAAIPEGADLPSLDDPQEVNYLLYSHALAAANRLSEAARKHVSRQEVIDADKKASAFLASALLGKNPAYAPAKVNTPETIERRLRSSAVKSTLTGWFNRAGCCRFTRFYAGCHVHVYQRGP